MTVIRYQLKRAKLGLQLSSWYLFNGAPFSYKNRKPHLYDFFLLPAAPPLIGQERSRNMPTPLQINEKKQVDRLVGTTRKA